MDPYFEEIKLCNYQAEER